MEQLNWKDIIKERVDVHNEQFQKFSSTLRKVVSELGPSPYNLKVKVDDVDDLNMVWRVEINKMVKEFNPDDFIIGIDSLEQRAENLEKAIQNAILRKFEWTFKNVLLQEFEEDGIKLQGDVDDDIDDDNDNAGGLTVIPKNPNLPLDPELKKLFENNDLKLDLEKMGEQFRLQQSLQFQSMIPKIPNIKFDK